MEYTFAEVPVNGRVEFCPSGVSRAGQLGRLGVTESGKDQIVVLTARVAP